MTPLRISFVVVVPAFIAVAVAIASSGRDGFDGAIGSRVLYDAAIAARAEIFGRGRQAATVVPVAVIALDEKSLDAPELYHLPRAMMSPVWAELIEDVVAADASVIGLDMLFAFDGNRFKPGYDKAFLRSLAEHRDRIVVARSAASVPFRAVVAAIGGAAQLAYGELDGGADHVVRRVNARAWDGESLAGALLSKSGFAHQLSALLAPTEHIENIPTYALVDILRCAGTAPDEVRAALAGRIVLVGTTLAEEDRQVASDRWFGRDFEKTVTSSARCLHEKISPSLPGSSTRPGVHVHAAAVRALGGAASVAAVDPIVTYCLGLLATGTAVWVAATAPAAMAAAAPFLLSGAIFVITVGALQAGWWIPGGTAMAGAAIGAPLAYIARWLTIDRKRRHVQRAFGHYLAPALVAELAESTRPPGIGGEARELTVIFADLADFTRFSQTVDPGTLMKLTNIELSAIGKAVEAELGYIDKFIGDGLMALWNAPLEDPDHAVHAVRAALAIYADNQCRLIEARARRTPGFSVRIGVNTGPAIVGNVGTDRRLNYTAMGEAVNIAARLESIPKVYDCSIVLGEETAQRVRDQILLRELDRICVRGREKPLSIFEPLCPMSEATGAQRRSAEAYSGALSLYRDRRFLEAAREFERLSAENDTGGPAAVLAARCRVYLAAPPPDDWDTVHNLS